MEKKINRTNGYTEYKYIVGLLSLLLYFFYFDGTVMFAVGSYIMFWFMVQLAVAGYHRWISHGVIQPTLLGKCLMWFCIVSVGSIRPSTYATIHRLHHKFYDTEYDPHPVTVGLWGFLMGKHRNNSFSTVNQKNMFKVRVLDLYRRKDIQFVDKYYWQLYLLTLMLFAVISIKLALLSIPFLVLRYHIHNALLNYLPHNGGTTHETVDLPLIPGIIFFGEHLHLTHHLNPGRTNYGDVSKINFDFMYYFLHHLKLIKN